MQALPGHPAIQNHKQKLLLFKTIQSLLSKKKQKPRTLNLHSQLLTTNHLSKKKRRQLR